MVHTSAVSQKELLRCPGTNTESRHPIKKSVDTMQVLERGVKINGKTVYDLEAVFVPPSLIDEYGCIRKRSKAVRKAWECRHFHEATQ